MRLLQSVIRVSNAGPSIPTHIRSYTDVPKVHFLRSLVILLMDIYTRVAGIGINDEWPGGSKTVGVLVENDVTLILDKLFQRCQRGGNESNRRKAKYLALLVDTVNLSPSRVTSLQLDAGMRETGPQGIAGFPGMIMRDLTVDMMGDMGLRDTVRAGGSDPGHDRSKITKEVTIISRQGTTRESELGGAVMRKEGVGVLQEGD